MKKLILAALVSASMLVVSAQAQANGAAAARISRVQVSTFTKTVSRQIRTLNVSRNSSVAISALANGSQAITNKLYNALKRQSFLASNFSRLSTVLNNVTTQNANKGLLGSAQASLEAVATIAVAMANLEEAPQFIIKGAEGAAFKNIKVLESIQTENLSDADEAKIARGAVNLISGDALLNAIDNGNGRISSKVSLENGIEILRTFNNEMSKGADFVQALSLIHI